MNAATARHSLLRTLRHRSFRCLTTGRTLTHLANAMAPIILAFATLDLTGSAIDVGIVVGGRSVANIVLVLLGGILADRLRRSLILQGSSIASAMVQAAVAVTLLTNTASVAVLLLLSVANGAVSAMAMPASASLIPKTVPAEELRRANALTRMGVNTGMIIGASFGGMITALSNPGWGIATNAVVFSLAAVTYRFVRVEGSERGGGSPSAQTLRPLQELREGWHEFTSRTWVWIVVTQFFVVNAVMAGGIYVLGPTIADDTFGRTAWGFALAAQMIGALVGGFLVGRARTKHALRLGVAVVALDALPLLALSEPAPVAVLVVAMFINGMALEQFGVAWDLSLQENIPSERLARVYAYDMLGSILALPIGEITAGVLAENVGTRTTLLAGVCLVAVATTAALCSKQVRALTTRSGKPDDRPEEAAHQSPTNL